MRKLAIILSFSVLLCLVSSCDFLRRISGRPTSDEIAAKKTLIQERAAKAAQEAGQARDSVLAAINDSLVATDPLPASPDNWRYSVVVGSFREEDNAQKMLGKVYERGYRGFVVKMNNGLCAVCLCPTNDEKEAEVSLESLKKEPFCPGGAWILENK